MVNRAGADLQVEFARDFPEMGFLLSVRSDPFIEKENHVISVLKAPPHGNAFQLIREHADLTRYFVMERGERHTVRIGDIPAEELDLLRDHFLIIKLSADNIRKEGVKIGIEAVQVEF